MSPPDRAEALRRLEPFVGVWAVAVPFMPAEEGTELHTRFEWALDGQFLVQRTEIPTIPEAPDSLILYAPDLESGGYRQHYFDSRGVVRIYTMTFDGRLWTLLRDAPDFTPLSFSQRFRGSFSEDLDRIEGRAENREPGAAWELDFDIVYTRVG